MDNLAVEVLPSVSLTNSLGFASIAEDADTPVDDTLVNNEEELFIGYGQSIPESFVDEAEASILIQHNQTALLQGMINLMFATKYAFLMTPNIRSENSLLRKDPPPFFGGGYFI